MNPLALDVHDPSQAAAHRGLCTEQLRARLRTIAYESRETTTHVAFEHARDGNFSD